MKALVIDDSRVIRSILAGMLRKLGYETIEACDGAEALAKVRSGGPFDLALVDWDMPVMTGLDFVKAVRADAAYASMRLMMVTAQSDLNCVSNALVAGADEYVMKPITPEMIREKIELLQIGM